MREGQGKSKEEKKNKEKDNRASVLSQEGKNSVYFCSTSLLPQDQLHYSLRNPNRDQIKKLWGYFTYQHKNRWVLEAVVRPLERM